MSKNRLCNTCGISFKRNKKKGPDFCSEECKHQGQVKLKKCNPCNEKTAHYRLVTFSNNTHHVQKYCELCLKTSFVSYEIGLSMGVYPDFITDVMREPEFARKDHRKPNTQLPLVEEDLCVEGKDHGQLLPKV